MLVPDTATPRIRLDDSNSFANDNPAAYAPPNNRLGAEFVSVSGFAADPWTPSELSLLHQMRAKARAVTTVLSSLIPYVSVSNLVRTVLPSAFIWSDEDREEARGLATSHSWLDRKMFHWVGLCGAIQVRQDRGRYGQHKDYHSNQHQFPPDDRQSWQLTRISRGSRQEGWTYDERRLREIPDYIFEYAPLVHLYSDEQFWPCDIAEHLYHITPTLNYTPVQPRWQHPTLVDLDNLNQWQHGRFVFLTSNDNVEDRPTWLEGEKNIPDSGDVENGELWEKRDTSVDGELPGELADNRKSWHGGGQQIPENDGASGLDAKNLHTPWHAHDRERFNNELKSRYSKSQVARGGRSDAPAVLIAVDKGDGVVDAFWFYFYSFNLGNMVLNIRFGNHVGDWEHSLVRFHNGKPRAVFFSEHSGGEAYSYEAVEKIGNRPVIYSAAGTHAMYATPGTHSYILPWGLLHDQTNRGPLWDPVLNSHTYTYDHVNDTLRASNVTPHAPMEWFYFSGHWGDKIYPLSDSRQYRFAGQYHYVNGPLGPRFKNLGRRKVCQGSDTDPCVIRNWIYGPRRAKRWKGVGEGEEISEEDLVQLLGNNSLLDVAEPE